MENTPLKCGNDIIQRNFVKKTQQTRMPAEKLYIDNNHNFKAVYANGDM